MNDSGYRKSSIKISPELFIVMIIESTWIINLNLKNLNSKGGRDFYKCFVVTLFVKALWKSWCKVIVVKTELITYSSLFLGECARAKTMKILLACKRCENFIGKILRSVTHEIRKKSLFECNLKWQSVQFKYFLSSRFPSLSCLYRVPEASARFFITILKE